MCTNLLNKCSKLLTLKDCHHYDIIHNLLQNHTQEEVTKKLSKKESNIFSHFLLIIINNLFLQFVVRNNISMIIPVNNILIYSEESLAQILVILIQDLLKYIMIRCKKFSIQVKFILMNTKDNIAEKSVNS